MVKIDQNKKRLKQENKKLENIEKVENKKITNVLTGKE